MSRATRKPTGASLRTAKRRLSYVTPESAPKVARHERYWTPTFLRLYFRRCELERFQDPQDTLRLLAPAETLVERVCAREISPEIEIAWKVRWHGLHGETAAWAGDPDLAALALLRARRFLELGRLPPGVDAELYRRQGAVARLMGQTQNADNWLARAVELYPQPKASHPATLSRGLAEALVLRGSLGKPESFPGLTWALTLVTPRKGSLEMALVEGALWWLHEHLPDTRVGLERIEHALSWLTFVRKKKLISRFSPWAKTAALHAEGRLLQRLRLDRLAVRRLAKALSLAERAGRSEQIALCALDLAAEQRAGGEPKEAQETLVRASGLLAEHPEPAELLNRAADSCHQSTFEELRVECEVPAMGYAGFEPLEVVS